MRVAESVAADEQNRELELRAWSAGCNLRLCLELELENGAAERGCARAGPDCCLCCAC